jgi:hypothetical protein
MGWLQDDADPCGQESVKAANLTQRIRRTIARTHSRGTQHVRCVRNELRGMPSRAVGRFSEIGAACAIARDDTPYWCVTFGEPEAP